MELTYAQAFNIVVNVSGQAPLVRKDHEMLTASLQKLKELIDKCEDCGNGEGQSEVVSEE